MRAFRARSFAIFVCLGLAFGPLASADEKGTLSLFRWNPGFRAESDAVMTLELSEPEYKKFLETSELPEAKDYVYSGCYLSHFERKPSGGRAPAVARSRPKTEIFRVCVPRK